MVATPQIGPIGPGGPKAPPPGPEERRTSIKAGVFPLPPNGFEIIRRAEAARRERVNWENHWQDVADMVQPTRDFTVKREPGTRRRSKIFNDRAPNASESLAAALHGLLINPALRWGNLYSVDFDDNRDEQGAAWLYDATSRVLEHLGSIESGFAMASHEIALDLVGFGTGINLIRESRANLRFQARALADFYIEKNDWGIVDTVFRFVEMSARDAKRRFGEEALSPEVQELLRDRDEKKRDTLIQFWHAVAPRSFRDPSMLNARNKPFMSIYVEIKTKHIVAESGFAAFPYLSPRWEVAPEEMYGRSPAMKVLPSVFMVNAMSKTIAMSGELRVMPPMNIPARGIVGNFSTLPGAKNYYKLGTREFASPVLTGADPLLGVELLQHFEKPIEDAHFLNALQLPEIDRMTREEVITRRQQGLLLASPILSRLYAEWLSPVFLRTFDWALRTRRLAPPPAQLAGRRIGVRFAGPMALAQRQAEADGFNSALESNAQVIAIDPGVVQNLDTDMAFRDVFALHNVNPKYLRSPRDVARLRQQQAEREAAEQQAALEQAGAQASQAQARAFRDLSEAQTNAA